MLTVLGIMLAGVLCGYLLRNRAVIRLSNGLITYAIYLLLLILGITVGTNPEIMDNLDSIGLQALVITIGAVLGSIVVAKMVYRYLFANKGGDAQ